MALSTEFTTIVSLFSGIAAIIACIKLISAPLDKIKVHENEIKESLSLNQQKWYSTKI